LRSIESILLDVYISRAIEFVAVSNAAASWQAIQMILTTFELLCDQNSDSYARVSGKLLVQLREDAQIPSMNDRVSTLANLLDKLGEHDYAEELLERAKTSLPYVKNDMPRSSSTSTASMKRLLRLQLTERTNFEDSLSDLRPQTDALQRQHARLDFVPDPWQERLIELIDRGKSVIVSAPTSSGKTFLGFYVMETTLRQNPKGVIVYVSPTKALVNQTYAEVYRRFNVTVGMFTADSKINVTSAKILVTVPAQLEILLLSHSQLEWRQRLAYVILDELHTINDLGSGSSWEHILLMLTCPFVRREETTAELL
jgi:superfamily II RNA helicase